MALNTGVLHPQPCPHSRPAALLEGRAQHRRTARLACLTVPNVAVSHVAERMRASPKSATLAVKPRLSAPEVASSTLPPARSPCITSRACRKHRAVAMSCAEAAQENQGQQEQQRAAALAATSAFNASSRL